MGYGNGPVHEIHYQWLAVLYSGITSCRIPYMPDAHKTFQVAKVIFLKNIRHKPHTFEGPGTFAIMNRNTCGFLAPMLQGI